MQFEHAASSKSVVTRLTVSHHHSAASKTESGIRYASRTHAYLSRSIWHAGNPVMARRWRPPDFISYCAYKALRS